MTGRDTVPTKIMPDGRVAARLLNHTLTPWVPISGRRIRFAETYNDREARRWRWFTPTATTAGNGGAYG